jgi:probable addiction module antidote protein
MPKRVMAYRDWIGEKLSDPIAAAAYLNAARKDSPEAFFKALRRVAESHQMAKVAEDAGVSRESLYRMTMVSSNPTHNSFEGILRALHLDYRIVPALSPATAEIRNDTPKPQHLSFGIKSPGKAVDATWKLNPSLAGYIEDWNTPAPITILPFAGNPDAAPVVQSANSNPGGMIAAMQPRLAHARREMEFQNARQ